MESTMKVGMLWLDDDKKSSLEEKIRQAAEFYKSKYGSEPNTCFVNSASLAHKDTIDRVEVVPAGYILPHHFWIGVSNSSMSSPEDSAS